MSRRYICFFLCLIFAVTSVSAFAETADGRGNLEERFSDVDTVDFNGATYYQKSRIKSMLFLGICDDGTDLGELGLLMAVVVDDNLKTITPIQFDYRTVFKNESKAQSTLKDAYENSAAKEEACENVLAAVNTLFPSPLIESYLGFDIEGLKLIDGNDFLLPEEEVQAKVKERLKEIKPYAETMSADSATDMMDALSEYIHTDMKSGALMKITDKIDRYEIRTTLHPQMTLFYEGNEISEEQLTEEDIVAEDIAAALDGDAFMQNIIDIFYDEIYW